MIMDQYTERQILIDRRRDEMVARYPSLWDELIAEWKSPGSDDRAWLMYSANYLFRTRGVRWAMDPLSLQSRIPQAPRMDAARDLKDLDFVLLSHRHRDHLDSALLRALCHLPILWVVPEAMFQLVQREIGLPASQILVPKLMQPIEIRGLRITAFDGLHWEAAPDYPTGRRGVPATGYLVEQGNKRWLFPGDTRKYDPAAMPDLGPVDVLFAHLWLGRGAANHPSPVLLDRFCRFCLALKPHRIILSHLEEWGRKAADFWDLEHARLVVAFIKQFVPSMPIEIALTGDRVLLELAQQRNAPNTD
jgi:L-ascorbate metabolism protein UlaG (beta-lactamase superfamily)